AGAYEHTLRAQAMGQDVRAVIELGRFPGVVLAVGKDRSFKSFADLKGLKIGVTAPNSSSHFFVLYLMAKAGLMPSDASFVGVGGGERAVEAMKTGEIDAVGPYLTTTGTYIDKPHPAPVLTGKGYFPH